MKALITGSSGFLGKIIKENLKDYSIYDLNRNSGNYRCSLEKEIPDFKERFDLIIHAAGKAHSVPKTELEKELFNEVNYIGTQNLLNALDKSGFPKYFIFISSVSVYGLDSGELINEEKSLLANDPYGLSKIKSEILVENWCEENNIICTILRLPLLVGKDAPGNLGAMVRSIKKGYYFNIGGGRAKKSMVLALDVAKIIPKVAEIGGTYNLTDGFHPNFYQLSEVIALSYKKKRPKNLPLFIAKIMGKMGDLLGSFSPINSLKVKKINSDLTFDDEKARRLLQWEPQSVIEFISEEPI
ncbi:nucleoside-diphosphate-sugar epimerase [Flavobacterium sp. 2755]|uniref:NAD-dependent epimerase/dehydratase family protein n=1 Tax=Flavobacterium sp. 2755 TaxID=2817765 RepID=UPI00285ADA62|nr:NAD-dependent epimerase/dehydratase family protein [Flavobacterium sp. 2755]MDR6762512.1 nucleoside-diphosphate-sugar epimerase [Flavobacterium sp. 2755]